MYPGGQKTEPGVCHMLEASEIEHASNDFRILSSKQLDEDFVLLRWRQIWRMSSGLLVLPEGLPCLDSEGFSHICSEQRLG